MLCEGFRCVVSGDTVEHFTHLCKIIFINGRDILL